MLWHLPLPEWATEIGLDGPESLVIEELGVALHGVSYGRPEVTEDLSKLYPDPIGGFFNVGLLHTAAEGRIGHDCYAPCRVKALVRHGYDYWALGHPHTPEIAAWEPPVVFPGNLQGRNFRERGPRGAVIVEVVGTAAVRLEHRPLDSLRFENVVVPAARAETLDDVHEFARVALLERVAENGEVPLVVRLIIEGRSAAAALVSVPSALRASALRSAAREAGGPGVFVDEAWALVREEPGWLFRVDASDVFAWERVE
jgi:DNA repair exonuclease SbcCD nuclease subunit